MAPAERPRRIILLTYYYPPSPEVGGLRAEKVARAFHQAGHEVVVITAALDGEQVGVRSTGGSEPRILTVAPANPREWIAQFRRRLRRPSRPAPQEAATAEMAERHYTMPRRVPLWKRAVFALLWLPDDRQGFIGPAVAKGREWLRPGDVIYTTAPPFSVHLAGLRLKGTGVRWLAEFRDPWTDNPWKPAHVRTALTDAIERRLERRCLRHADLIVGVSRGIIRILHPKVADPEGRLLLVRNGIERLLPPAAEPGRPFRIVHVGTFYHGRDPRPFLAGLAALRRRRPLQPGDVLVALVGRCRWFNGISVEAEVQRLGLGDIVHFHDWLPHEDCQRLVETADALLLLARQQPDQVPNKLYEYLGTRRPIIALVDDEGESAAMLRQVGGYEILTTDDPEAIAAALERLLDRTAPAPPGQALEEWTVERQMGKLVDALETLP